MVLTPAPALAFRWEPINVSLVPHRRSRLAPSIALVVATLLAGAPRVAGAEVFGNTFRAPLWGVEMTVPRGWELSDQGAYPGILARAYERKGRARMSLAAQQLGPDEDPRAYVERNQKSLARLGYKIVAVAPHPSGALLLDSTTPDGKRQVRQAYVTVGDTVFVLSLAVLVDLAAGYVRPFEETLRNLSFTTPATPAPVPAEAPPPSPTPTETPTP